MVSQTMTTRSAEQRMILCAGLQSGGTTLPSWCFLQRRDTNGVLDMPSDVIQPSFDRVTEPIVWCKMTIASYRWVDLAGIYRDLGWNPEPLLVVRDVRAAYSSLSRKWYGVNGTTAEDPPLRMRFRRFLQDWELFSSRGWPTLKYEDLIADERASLISICGALSLQWDEAMLTWPKLMSDIAYVGKMNKTFQESVEKGSLARAKLRDRAQVNVDQLPQYELKWLEDTFEHYNEVHGYQRHIKPSEYREDSARISEPRFDGTARHWYYSENKRLRAENDSLRRDNEALRRLIGSDGNGP